MGIPVTMSDMRFSAFIAKEIFPGGSVPGEEQIVTLSPGGRLHRRGQATARRALCPHARPVVEALEAHREEAVAATSEEVYERYMKYLVGCSDFFNRRISELGQFTLVKG